MQIHYTILHILHTALIITINHRQIVSLPLLLICDIEVTLPPSLVNCFMRSVLHTVSVPFFFFHLFQCDLLLTHT